MGCRTCRCRVLRLLRGRTVDAAIGAGELAGGRWSAGDVQPFARAVLTAVAGLHAEGFAHCDLKAENLMLQRKGALATVVVIDLGCARKNGVTLSRLQHGRGTAVCRYCCHLLRGAPPCTHLGRDRRHGHSARHISTSWWLLSSVSAQCIERAALHDTCCRPAHSANHA